MGILLYDISRSHASVKEQEPGECEGAGAVLVWRWLAGRESPCVIHQPQETDTSYRHLWHGVTISHKNETLLNLDNPLYSK